MNPGLFLRTVWPLKPSQWAWRLKRTLKGLQKPEPPSGPPADFLEKASKTPPPGPPIFHPGPKGAEAVRGITRGSFTLVNQMRQLGSPNPDWLLGPQTSGRLWAITLHYHGWAYELAQKAPGLFEELVKDYLAKCGRPEGGALDFAWNSYAVATRIHWWCRCHAKLGKGFWKDRPDFEKEFLTTLWRQADFLFHNVEWDLRANHVIRDALGLLAAGRFFAGAGKDPDLWAAKGADILKDQVQEQVLEDGAHFELSPMYHLVVMDDLLQAHAMLPDGSAQEALRDALAGMLEYAAWVRHPDGMIPLLNDSTLHGAPDPKEILTRAAQTLGKTADPSPRRGLKVFTDSGLTVWHGENYSVFFDAGPLGPDVQPGHGHADHLTLELSWDGGRLFVDPGACAYDDDERRRYDRSTASHNTVVVDGMDSSELWGVFRAGRRAFPRHLEVRDQMGGFRASAEHDGYDHLSGRPRHGRTVEAAGGQLRIKDTVAGKGVHSLSGGFLLAPGWEAAVEGPLWRIAWGDRYLEMTVRGREDVQLSVEDAEYHPEFGVEIPVSRLVWRWTGPLPFSVEFYLKAL